MNQNGLIPATAYREIFQAVPVPMAILEQASLKFLEVNPAFLQLIGLSLSALRQLNIFPFLEVDASFVFQACEQIPIILKSKQRLQRDEFLLSLQPLEIEDKPCWLAVFLQPNLSSELRNPTVLEQENQNLKTISRRKSELIANISHELRTPLTAILGWPEIILDSQVSELAQQAARAIQKDGAILLGLLEDLIDLSKIEAGQMQLDPRPENLNEVLENAVNVLREKAEARAISLQLHLPELRVIANIDPLRITQVVLNFLSNAIKFTPVGGQIILELTLLEEEVQISIADNGSGLAQEHQQRIFERFAQADNQNAITGAGIGLALVKEFVEMHGGRTWVESEKGYGATFFFTLPLLRLEKPEEEAKSSEKTLEFEFKRPIRILATDPNLTNQQVLSSMLNHPKISLIFCDWELLYERASKGDIDAILLESSSQNFEASLALMQKIHQGMDTCQIPVIAMSTSAMKGDRESYLSLGYDAYLSKPFTKKDLLKCIHQVIQRENHV